MHTAPGALLNCAIIIIIELIDVLLVHAILPLVSAFARAREWKINFNRNYLEAIFFQIANSFKIDLAAIKFIQMVFGMAAVVVVPVCPRVLWHDAAIMQYYAFVPCCAEYRIIIGWPFDFK